MRYLKIRTSNSLNIQKSIFIGISTPINSIEDVAITLQSLKKEYPKATHYCYAYIFGDQQQYQSFNDDGEPARTAGLPILEMLKKADVTNCLCVVIRYFGGIKLGAGGLIRAYMSASKASLALGEYYRKKVVSIYKLSFHYNQIDFFNHYLKERAVILDQSFLETVVFTLYFHDESMIDVDTINTAGTLIKIETKEIEIEY